MQLSDFIRQFRNHPVLFVGTGMSLRYLENSYSWDDLLKKICFELKGNNEYYYDLGEGENHGKIKKSNLLKACENPIYVNTIIMNIAWNIYHDSDKVYKIFYDYKGEDNFDYRSADSGMVKFKES